MIGQTISHYKILDKLGEGGMGVVYKAEDTKLHRPVALKFLPPELTRDVEAKERFVHEAQAASALDHPNIAVVHEIDETKDGSSFICMAYYEGKTLKEKIETASLEAEQAIDIARQIAEGLQRAHEAGIVHRDLKPANVIVTNRGEVKIVDFGLAKLMGGPTVTRTGRMVGTAAYMSPEQTRGETVDHRTDIWSFGVVLYEMLTGQLPFKGEFEQAVLYSILNQEPTELSGLRHDVPDHLQSLCKRCLEKDPAARPMSMREVLALLEPKAAAAPAPARIRLMQIRGIRFRSRQLLLLLSGVALFAALTWLLLSRVMGPTTPVTMKWRVAILPFQATTKAQEMSEWPLTAQALFVRELTGIEEFGVVDPLSLNGLIESSFGTTVPQRGPDLNRIMKDAEIAFVIDGIIAKSADTYKVQANVMNPLTEEVYYSADASLNSTQDLPFAVGTLSRQFVDFFQVKILRAGGDRDLRPWLSDRAQNMGALKAFMQASELIYRGQPGAEKLLRRAVELDSTFIAPRIWLISGLVYRGKVQEAVQQHQHLLKLESEANPFDRAMIGWAKAYLSGDLAAQAQYLQVALDYSPGNNILLYNLGRVRVLMGNFEGAITALKPAVEMKWNYSPVYSLLGECYNEVGKYNEAEKVLERSLSVKPVYPEVYSLLSALSLRADDTTKAREYEVLFVQRSTEAGYPLGTAYGALAARYLSDGFYDHAIKVYHLAVSIEPNNPAHHGGLGEGFFKKGDVDAARTECLRALQLDSAWIQAHLVLAQIFDKAGQQQEALSHYKAYLWRDSTSSDANAVRQRVEALQD